MDDAPLTKADAEQLLKRVEDMLRPLQTVAIPIQVPARRPVREPSPVLGSQVSDSAGELASALRDVPQHRIQRKDRNLAPRVAYRVKPVKTGEMIKTLQSLTPAAVAIIVYLVTHPGSTVPDLAVQLDLRRKTVQNLLSILSQRELIQADPLK